MKERLFTNTVADDVVAEIKILYRRYDILGSLGILLVIGCSIVVRAVFQCCCRTVDQQELESCPNDS